MSHISANTIDDSKLPQSLYGLSENGSAVKDSAGNDVPAMLFENLWHDTTISRHDANHIRFSDYSSEVATIWWVADEVSAAWLVRRFAAAINCWHDLFQAGTEFQFTLGDTESENVYRIHVRFVGYYHYGNDSIGAEGSITPDCGSFLDGCAAMNSPEHKL